MVLVFPFVCMMEYIYLFTFVEPSLQQWDEAYLIIVGDLFDLFLDFIDLLFLYFIENFCFCIFLHNGE